MDCVFIEGLVVYAQHGATDAEQEVGRPYRFDVRLYLDTSEAAATDELAKTVNYAKAARLIAEVATGRRVRIVERLAELVVSALFDAFPRIDRIHLRLAKLSPPAGMVLEAAGVEIERERQS